MSRNPLKAIHLILSVAGIAAITILMVIGIAGCGITTIRETIVLGPTSPPNAATTSVTVTVTSTLAPPPPGIWCLVKQDQRPLTPPCEIYPSSPQLATPPQSEATLAGTPVGPQIGSGGASTVTERMIGPLWAADVICSTTDQSNTGEVQILMVAHTSSGDYYSWGDESCGPPSAPDYGMEFFRKATDSITLSIRPVTDNVGFWSAQLLQL